MNDDRETPAKTIDLTTEDAAHALAHKRTKRHGAIDAHADLYNSATGLRALLHQYSETAHEFSDDSTPAVDEMLTMLDEFAAAAVADALENHEHAIRWTLDPYDEMDDHA